MIDVNLDNVKAAGEYEKLPPGGYICGIVNVRHDIPKQYIEIFYDIADGAYKNYWRNAESGMGFWGGSFKRSYKEKALPFFKAFIEAIERSNPDYRWDGDESKLKGKWIGLVIGEEEYINKYGDLKVKHCVDKARAVEDIKAGDYKVPPLKKLKVQDDPFVPLDDGGDDLPF